MTWPSILKVKDQQHAEITNKITPYVENNSGLSLKENRKSLIRLLYCANETISPLIDSDRCLKTTFKQLTL